MLRYWLNKLFGKPTVRFFGPERLLYREQGRTIQIDIHNSATGDFAIDLGSIMFWDDEPDRSLGEAERQKIAYSVKAAVKSQWNQSCTVD